MRQAGFTLIEIMVAVTVTTLLLFTIYGVFSSVSGAKARVEGAGEDYHQARVIFDRLGREIRSVYTPRLPADTAGRAAYAGAPMSGGENEEGHPFFTLSTTASTPQGGRMTGITIVNYELAPDPQRDDPEARVLLRREYSPLTADTEAARSYRLATGVEEMQLRFYDGANWLETWKSGLPKVVEITLVMSVEGQSVPFRSAFEIVTVGAGL